MITPEQLKKVAEYIDSSRPVEIEEDGVWYMNYPATTPHGRGYKILAEEYNPLQNSNQCLELMEKLMNKGFTLYPVIGNKFTMIQEDNKNPYPVSSTINEAVTLAAIAYVEALQDVPTVSE